MADNDKSGRILVTGRLRLDVYRLVSEAVSAGAQYGVRRAFKHTDTPSPDAIASEVENSVMNALAEYIIWDDQERDDA